MKEDKVRVQGRYETILRVTVRSPKETRGRKSAEVELWEDHLSPKLCPVSSFQKYLTLLNQEGDHSTSSPVFMRSNMTMACPQWLNSTLASWGKTHPELANIRLHSFRAMVPQLLRSQGESDDLIRRQGRWASTSYRHYVSDQRTALHNIEGQAQAHMLVSRALSAPDLSLT